MKTLFVFTLFTIALFTSLSAKAENSVAVKVNCEKMSLSSLIVDGVEISDYPLNHDGLETKISGENIYLKSLVTHQNILIGKIHFDRPCGVKDSIHQYSVSTAEYSQISITRTPAGDCHLEMTEEGPILFQYLDQMVKVISKVDGNSEIDFRYFITRSCMH